MQSEHAWNHGKAAKRRAEKYAHERGRDPKSILNLTAKDLGPELYKVRDCPENISGRLGWEGKAD